MSNNLGYNPLEQNAANPEAAVNEALERFDAAITETLTVDLSAGDKEVTLVQLQKAAIIIAAAATVAHAIKLPVSKRIIFARNTTDFPITYAVGTKNVVVPAQSTGILLLTGSADGLVGLSIAGSTSGTSLPQGGTTGQVLKKRSDANGDVVWANDEVGSGSSSGGSSTAPGPGRAYRYWRCLFTSTNGGNNSYISIAELEWRTTVDGPQKAIGGTPIASGSFNNTTQPQNAYDGDSNTIWENQTNANVNNGNIWLGYDFGVPVQINQIKIQKSSQYPTENPYGISIQGSNDNSAWQTEHTFITGFLPTDRLSITTESLPWASLQSKLQKQYSRNNYGNASTSTHSTKGVLAIPIVDIELFGMFGVVNEVANGKYAWRVFEVDANYKITALVTSVAYDGLSVATDKRTLRVMLPKKVTLIKDKKYLIAHSRTDAGNSVSTGVYSGDKYADPFDARSEFYATYAETNPQVNAVPTTSGPGGYSYGVIWRAVEDS